MLVLTRKLGESIVVPETDLTFTVLSITGNRVRIGIAGPPNVRVHREEVWRRLREADTPSEAMQAGAAVQ